MIESEFKIVISFIFKRSGKEKLTLSEVYLPLSMDLKWFSPQEAKEFVNFALKQKILNKKNDFIFPNFNYKDINIPIGYKPKKEILQKELNSTYEKKDILNLIVRRISEKTDLEEEKIFENINEIERTKNITKEVASLFLGFEYDVTLNDFLDIVESIIFD